MNIELIKLADVAESHASDFEYTAESRLPVFGLAGWEQLINQKAHITFKMNTQGQPCSQCLLYIYYGEVYVQETLVLLNVNTTGLGSVVCDFPSTLKGVRLVPVCEGQFSIVDLNVVTKGMTDPNVGVEQSEKLGADWLPAINKHSDYIKWINIHEPLVAEYANLTQMAKNWDTKPLISIVMPTYNTNVDFLRKAIESVCKQTYDNWELCIADDASTVPEVQSMLDHYSALDTRIKVTYLKENSHISSATNAAISLSTGDYIGFLDHDDVLHPLALHYVAQAILAHDSPGIIYSDEDKILSDGTRLSPYFKCDFNYDLFLSQNMICHFGVYRANIVKEIGGLREGFEGAQDYDLALRVLDSVGIENIVHIPHVLYHWRLHEHSTSISFTVKPYAQTAAMRAVQEHLDRRGVLARVEQDKSLPAYQRIRYLLPQTTSNMVEVIIFANSGFNHLERCLASVLQKTQSVSFNVTIVKLQQLANPKVMTENQLHLAYSRVRLVQFEDKLNAACAINSVVQNSEADFICILDESIEVIADDWLYEMLILAQREEVGCVGPKLLNSDHKVESAGIVLSEELIASDAYQQTPDHSAGYFSRLGLVSQYSAVRSECLLVSRKIYLENDGLDERLEQTMSVIDFCLGVLRLGYQNLFTPYAQLKLHQDSVTGCNDDTANISLCDEALMRSKWGDQLDRDPYYSPNLDNIRADFSLSWPSRVPNLLGMSAIDEC